MRLPPLAAAAVAAMAEVGSSSRSPPRSPSSPLNPNVALFEPHPASTPDWLRYSNSSDSMSDGPVAPRRLVAADAKGKGKMVVFDEDPPSLPEGSMADARRQPASSFMADARRGASPPRRRLTSVAVRVGDPMEVEDDGWVEVRPRRRGHRRMAAPRPPRRPVPADLVGLLQLLCFRSCCGCLQEPFPLPSLWRRGP